MQMSHQQSQCKASKWTRTANPKNGDNGEGVCVFDRSSGCPLPQADTNAEIQM